MSNGKGIIIHLIVGLIKKTLYKMSPKPYRSFGENISVKVDLSNYATKADSKDATGIDTCHFTLNSNLAGLETEVDKIDVDKLKTVPADLSKLSNVVNNGVVQKILKKSDTDKSDLEKKISDAEKRFLIQVDLLKK